VPSVGRSAASGAIAIVVCRSGSTAADDKGPVIRALLIE
jgi:hypothetical protein